MAVPADLTRKHAIVIDDAYVGTGGVTNFSVLLTRDAFNDEVCDPNGANKARSDGGDLRFSSDSAGENQLACDVITFAHDSDTGAGDANVQVMVLVPSIAGPTAGDTTIYVWYAGSTTTAQPAANDTYGSDNAYDAYWRGYWPNASTTDRTATGTDLTATGSPGTAAGKIGTAWTLDGSTQHLQAATPVTATPVTIMGWAYLDNDTLSQYLIGIFSNTLGSNNAWQVRFIGNAGGDPIYAQTLQANSAATASVGAFDPSTWYFAAGVFGSSISRYAYLDGTLSSEETTDLTPLASDIVVIGSRYNDGNNTYAERLSGRVESPSIHSTARSKAWLDTFYNQTNTPALFAAPGTPEDVGGGENDEIAPDSETIAPVTSGGAVEQWQTLAPESEAIAPATSGGALDQWQTVSPAAEYVAPASTGGAADQWQTLAPADEHIGPVSTGGALDQWQAVSPTQEYLTPAYGGGALDQWQTIGPDAVYIAPVSTGGEVSQDDGTEIEIDTIYVVSPMTGAVAVSSAITGAIHVESPMTATVRV